MESFATVSESPPCRTCRRRPYRYAKLSTTKNAIRTIKLLSGSPDVEIRCKVLETCTNSRFRKYHALSNTWGSSDKSRCIVLDDRCMRVTDNLLVALQSLRSWHSQVLWIDALCINQMDIDERNSQVSIMSHIYSAASKVIVWLGESQDHAVTQGLLSAMPKRYKEKEYGYGNSNRDYYLGEDYPRLVPYWKDLLHSPYFKRAWVLQEICCAEKLEVRHGIYTLKWPQLHYLANLVSSPKHTWFTERWTDETSCASAELILNLEAWRCSRQGDSRAMHLSLGFVLFETRYSICSDPRDKIYSTLALAPTKDKELIIKPDYGLTKERLDIIAAKACLDKEKSLEILNYVYHDSDDVRLPSWAPEWEYPKHFTMVPPDKLTPPRPYIERSDCIAEELWDSKVQPWPGSVDLLTLRGGFIQQIRCVSQHEPELKITWSNHSYSMDLSPHSEVFVDSWTWALLDNDKAAFMDSHNHSAELDLLTDLDIHSFFSHPPNDQIPGSEDFGLQEYTRQPKRNKVIVQAELEHYRMFCSICGPGMSPSSLCVSGRRISVTIDGYFVLVPPVTRPGDLIAAFVGLRHLFVVRKFGRLVGGRNVYILIGQCVVDDCFDWYKWETKSTNLEEVLLC